MLVRCHAGCDQRDVIAALRERGLWETTGRARHRPQASAPDCRRTRRRRPEAQRGGAGDLAGIATGRGNARRNLSALARARSSGFACPALSCRLETPLGRRLAGDGGAGDARRDGTPIAIHRTFLARDGGGKAPVDPQKMMLGPCRGGAVRLGEPGDVLMVGEGIETCLAAMQATGHPAWAALSTSGLRDARSAGRRARRDRARRWRRTRRSGGAGCAWRWKREGRRVRIARPPQGMDFNDLLVGRAPASRRARHDHRDAKI